MLSRFISYSFLCLIRRSRAHWPLWSAVVAGVALVGIGSRILPSAEVGSEIPGLNASQALAFLQWCSVVVALIQILILAARTLLSERSYFWTLASIGIPSYQIAFLRGAEMMIGLIIATVLGSFISVATAVMVFDTYLEPPSASMIVSSATIGLSPMLMIGIIPYLGRRRGR